MSTPAKSPVKIILASLIIVATVAYLAVTGVQDTKSYYVTISELQGMGHKAFTRHLRVAGNVAPGSIHRIGGGGEAKVMEQGRRM
jgi:cytochrome c-type biogenesis protein CcmE